MSFINDINSIYPIKITILAIPSITGTCLFPIPGTNLSNISAINNGNIININTENIIETATTHPIITFSAFSPNLLISHNSNLPGSSSVSSSSSKKDAEYVRDFIPSTRESIKLNTPLIKGAPKILFFCEALLYCFFSTSIVLSLFLTATEYQSLFLIIIPSITACPPIPEEPNLFLFFINVLIHYNRTNKNIKYPYFHNQIMLLTCISLHKKIG